MTLISCNTFEKDKYDLSSYSVVRYDLSRKTLGAQGSIVSRMDDSSLMFYYSNERDNCELLNQWLTTYELPISSSYDASYIETKRINKMEDELGKSRAVKQDIFNDINLIMHDLKLIEKDLPLSNIRLNEIRYSNDTIYLNSLHSILLVTDLMSDFSDSKDNTLPNHTVDIGFKSFNKLTTNPILAISLGISGKRLFIKYEDGTHKVFNTELTKNLYSYRRQD